MDEQQARWVEAGAKAIVRAVAEENTDELWASVTQETRDIWSERFLSGMSEALAAARADGVRLVRLPEKEAEPDGYDPCDHAFQHGFNAAIDAMKEVKL